MIVAPVRMSVRLCAASQSATARERSTPNSGVTRPASRSRPPSPRRILGTREDGATMISRTPTAIRIEAIATTEDDYVKIARDLANDPSRLASLHSTLRSDMKSSPLMNAPRFARNMEAAYRQMWQSVR